MRRTASGYSNGAWCLALTLLALLVGCGGNKEESAETTATTEEPATQAAPVVDAATAATIAGSIAFQGTAPKMTLIDVSSEATCHSKAEAHPQYTDNVVVNPNGTLRNVFVYVKEGLGGATFPPSSEAVVFDQQGCHYTPHVFGIQTNQPLRILNSDEGVLHNIHAFSKVGNGFNFGMPKVMESVKTFKKSEVMVRIKCDVHSWMGAYAGVVDHPFFAVSGDDGSFKLPPLPPGQYVIEAWHEEYGSQTQSVTVAPQETKEVSFSFGPSS